jgi:hypothetical protein
MADLIDGEPVPVTIRRAQTDGYRQTVNREVVFLIKTTTRSPRCRRRARTSGCRVAWDAEAALLKCPCPRRQIRPQRCRQGGSAARPAREVSHPDREWSGDGGALMPGLTVSSTGSTRARGSRRAARISSTNRCRRRELVVRAREHSALSPGLQLISGIVLAMYYVAAPDHAYDSVRYVTDHVPFGGSFAACISSARVSSSSPRSRTWRASSRSDPTSTRAKSPG